MLGRVFPLFFVAVICGSTMGSFNLCPDSKNMTNVNVKLGSTANVTFCLSSQEVYTFIKIFNKSHSSGLLLSLTGKKEDRYIATIVKQNHSAMITIKVENVTCNDTLYPYCIRANPENNNNALFNENLLFCFQLLRPDECKDSATDNESTCETTEVTKSFSRGAQITNNSTETTTGLVTQNSFSETQSSLAVGQVTSDNSTETTTGVTPQNSFSETHSSVGVGQVTSVWSTYLENGKERTPLQDEGSKQDLTVVYIIVPVAILTVAILTTGCLYIVCRHPAKSGSKFKVLLNTQNSFADTPQVTYANIGDFSSGSVAQDTPTVEIHQNVDRTVTEDGLVYIMVEHTGIRHKHKSRSEPSVTSSGSDSQEAVQYLTIDFLKTGQQATEQDVDCITSVDQSNDTSDKIDIVNEKIVPVNGSETNNT